MFKFMIILLLKRFFVVVWISIYIIYLLSSKILMLFTR